MFKRGLFVFLLTLSWSCSSETPGDSTVAAQEARVRSEESLASNFLARVEWAEAKSDEYRVLVQEAEEQLAVIRGDLRSLRAVNEQKAVELQRLTAESATLAAEIKKITAANAAAVAGLKKNKTALAKIEAERLAAEKALANQPQFGPKPKK